MKLDKIICLVGASGSGKTTIAKELEGKGYNIIHSYTTRQEREPGEWGHTFIPQMENMGVNYIKHSGLSVLNIEGSVKIQCPFTNRLEIRPYIYYSTSIIAFKEVYKNLYYWATKEQYQGKGTSIYVIDPEGAKQVKENVKDADVITIFINTDELERLQRLETRLGYDYWLADTKEEKEKHKVEVIDRLKKDEKIFEVVKTDYVVDGNKKLEEIIENIISIIGCDKN